MSYEITNFEKGVVTVLFNGKKPYQKIPVPIDHEGNYMTDALLSHLNYVDFMNSSTPNNAADIEALVVNASETAAECASCARKKRNLFLTLTDWTQMNDVPLTEEEKATMTIVRQELRDITNQVGFPTEIQWPEIPVMDPDEREGILNRDFCGG